MLNRNRTRFIAEYFGQADKDHVLAYAIVYDDRNNITKRTKQNASNLINSPEVKEEIKRWEFLIAQGTRLDASDFTAEVARLAMADARDIMGYYVGACRYCYGEGNRYQRTPAELANDLKQHVEKMAARKTPDPLGLTFDVEGGIGFDPRKQPIDDCPECHGFGTGYEVFNDTRYLTQGAARLFDGIKRTKDGLEVKIRSRDKMLLAAGQVLGALKPDGDKNDGTLTIKIEGGLPDAPMDELRSETTIGTDIQSDNGDSENASAGSSV